MNKDSPRDHPYGETDARNFDPDQVNTPEDVVGLLEWIAEKNSKAGHYLAAEVFRDAATMVDVSLVGGEDD